MRIEESIHVVFDESLLSVVKKENSKEREEFLKNVVKESIQHETKEGERNPNDNSNHFPSIELKKNPPISKKLGKS